MNKIFSVILAAAAFAGTLSADNPEGNLVKNGDFKHGFFHEAIPVKSAGNAKFVIGKESTTQNRFLRMEVVSLKNTDNRLTLNCAFMVGKNGKNYGFIVEPDTVYEISFDYKSSYDAVLWARSYKTKTEKHWVAQSIRCKPFAAPASPEKWTTYRGTFKTAANSVTAALMVQFWADSKSAKVMPQVGSYIEVDNIVIKKQAPEPGK